MELIFNPCGEFRLSMEGPITQIYFPHLQAGAPVIFSDLLMFVKMLKSEWGTEINGKPPHINIRSKTRAWVPKFAVEDLPLSRTAALVPEFAVKDLPLGRTLLLMMIFFLYNVFLISYIMGLQICDFFLQLSCYVILENKAVEEAVYNNFARFLSRYLNYRHKTIDSL